MSVNQKSVKKATEQKQVGQSMMRLLTNKELHTVAGGPKGSTPSSGPSRRHN